MQPKPSSTSGEEPAHLGATPPAPEPGQRTALTGVAASAGVAVGPAFVFAPAPTSAPLVPAETADGRDAGTERARLAAALERAIAETYALAERVGTEVGEAEGQIFAAQALLLEDPTMRERAEELIESERTSAESAWGRAAEEQAEIFEQLDEPLLQARAADVRDAARRVTMVLVPEQAAGPDLAEQLAALAEPVVLIARDLAPSDTVRAPVDRILGIATSLGGPTGHAAILARARDIPATLGLGDDLLSRVRSGETVVLDGTRGRVVVHPSAQEIAEARRAGEEHRSAIAARRSRAARATGAHGQTRDGLRVAVLANVGSMADAQAAGVAGADGVGLLRTEFLFASRTTLPTLEEQADMYAAIIAAVGSGTGRPIIIRTLDAGSDKPLPALSALLRNQPAEANPALGIRGIRLHHEQPALLVEQMGAILTAAARTSADVRVMVPMVATLEELAAAREALRAASTRQGAPDHPDGDPLPLGIMVETPAAVLCAETLAQHAEFFSIGTNDLTQYVMAADRLHPRLTALADPLQPAVLHAIAQVAQAAARFGRPVGVCGEMAGDPAQALLLVGLGVGELSMTPSSIPAVKEALAARTSAELRERAVAALQAETATQVQELLRDWR